MHTKGRVIPLMEWCRIAGSFNLFQFLGPLADEEIHTRYYHVLLTEIEKKDYGRGVIITIWSEAGPRIL